MKRDATLAPGARTVHQVGRGLVLDDAHVRQPGDSPSARRPGSVIPGIRLDGSRRDPPGLRIPRRPGPYRQASAGRLRRPRRRGSRLQQGRRILDHPGGAYQRSQRPWRELLGCWGPTGSRRNRLPPHQTATSTSRVAYGHGHSTRGSGFHTGGDRLADVPHRLVLGPPLETRSRVWPGTRRRSCPSRRAPT